MKPRRFRKGRAWNSEPLAKRLERNKRAEAYWAALSGKDKQPEQKSTESAGRKERDE